MEKALFYTEIQKTPVTKLRANLSLIFALGISAI